MLDHDLCPDKHTPLCSGKTKARKWWMKTTDIKSPVLTISPGALDAFRWMEWQGPIHICDICEICIQHAWRMRGHYKELVVKPPKHESVQQATWRLACRLPRGSRLVVDCDLAFCAKKAAPILLNILQTLVEEGIRARVLLTYVNHRDGMRTPERIRVLKSALPRGATYVESYTYVSAWSREDHKYSKGSSMAVADIRT